MSVKYVIKLTAVVRFFKDEQKLISRGENAVESGHVTNMVFDTDLGILKGSVHDSMRDKEYKVEVSYIVWLFIILKCNNIIFLDHI